ncbi:MAG: flavodoxin/nitric oxide synthase [Puniceicoccaceae bacterium 5H]|nr:MAG: flavodoxin/nitric oxide synthase [Puniceicoccaceae bacterium 5H]
MSEHKLTILYGTETGNCRGLAQKVAAKAQKNGLEADVFDLAAYSVDQLAAVDNPVLVIISTWDEGAPPPKARKFCADLLSQTPDLSGLSYTVLALGDTEYEQFCECGRQIDARLEELGASCCLERTELGADFMVSYIGWSKKFWKRMAEVYGVAK